MVNPVKQAKQSSPLGSDCLQVYEEADWIELLAKLKQSSSNPQSGLLVDNCARDPLTESAPLLFGSMNRRHTQIDSMLVGRQDLLRKPNTERAQFRNVLDNWTKLIFRIHRTWQG
jgi:hypothetical protein